MPTISISANPTGTIANGANITFTAAITNAVSNISYNWKVNGVSVQNSTSATYSSTKFKNGDIVECILSSTPALTCGFSLLVNSNSITTSVTPPPTYYWVGGSGNWSDFSYPQKSNFHWNWWKIEILKIFTFSELAIESRRVHF
jgi:hypothetical protein